MIMIENNKNKEKMIMSNQRLNFERSTTDRYIAGICGALAQILSVPSLIVRLIMIIAAFSTGFFPIFIVYMILWITTPTDDSNWYRTKKN